MLNSLNTNSENGNLVPISELEGEWIDNYLNESAAPRGEEIPSYEVKYPHEGVQLRVVFSSSHKEQIEQLKGVMRLGFQTTSDLDGGEETLLPDPQTQEEQLENDAEAGTRGSEEAVHSQVDGTALPDLEVPVDPSDPTFIDTYYATLLRTYPDHILITVDFSELAQTRSQTGNRYNLELDAVEIEHGQTVHYRAQLQKSARVMAEMDHGEVRVELWHWQRGQVTKKHLGTQWSSVRGWENIYPGSPPIFIRGEPDTIQSLIDLDRRTNRCYDVSVHGVEPGTSTFRMYYSWERENSESEWRPCFG